MSAVSEIAIGVPAGRRGYSTALLLLGILFLAGAVSFAYLLATSPESVPWSFFVANYVFLLGISQFGVAFSAIMRICRTDWGRPFYRLGEIMTLAFFPFAIVLFLLIYSFGKAQLFYWLSPGPGEHLSPWLNADFMLLRNLVAQLTFYGLTFVYFLMGLLPDVTSESTQTGPAWRRGIYRWLWSLRQRRDDQKLKANMFLFAPVVLVVAVIANTFIAWDFCMMLFPHYHSTVFPMYFILGNMLAGTAAVLLLGAVARHTLRLENFFGVTQLKSMGIVLTGFALLWLYMFWAQFFVSWFGNLPRELGPMDAQMTGHYAPFFWVMIFCVFGFPLGALIFSPVKRHWWSLLFVAAVINVGVWINRYILIVPALIEDHVPFSSAMEFILAVGLLAGFLTIFLLLFRVFPMISTWEMRDSAGEEGPAY
jgi:molybdopterin-containing oxidoreductase family membrane subunit